MSASASVSLEWARSPQVEVALGPELPQIGFFVRDLVEMGLVNAIHNSLNHARTRLPIEAGMQEGCLVLRLHDDLTDFQTSC